MMTMMMIYKMNFTRIIYFKKKSIKCIKKKMLLISLLAYILKMLISTNIKLNQFHKKLNKYKIQIYKIVIRIFKKNK